LKNVAQFLLEQKFGYIPTSDMLMYHHRATARLRDVLGTVETGDVFYQVLSKNILKLICKTMAL